MAPAGLPRIDPPVVATTSRDPTRADIVGAAPATAPVTMTDAATTASAPIAPILVLRLAPDRRPAWLPDIRISLSSAYAGAQWQMPESAARKAQVAHVYHYAALC